MMHRLLSIGLSASLGLAGAMAESPGAADFAAAESALAAGEFEAAREAFAGIIETSRFAPEVFFGLGNSHYRLGDIGRAALAYRRALYLEPSFDEAKQNLKVIATTNPMVDTATPEAAAGRRIAKAGPLLIAIVGGVALAGVGGSVLLAFRRRSTAVNAFASICVLAGVGSAGTGTAFALQRDASRPPPDALVVVAEGAAGLSAPAGSASEILALPPGSALAVDAVRGNWAFVELGDGLKGWVDKKLLEPLWPFADGAPAQ